MAVRILIVEDQKIIAKGIEKRLKVMGYTVVGLAANGEEAVRKAVELQPDLILMDISLGEGMDGVEATSLIREKRDVPVVYLTAYSDEATLQRAKITGPFGYVLKPYDDKDLQIAIEIGLNKHRMDRRVRENEQWLAATLSSIGDGVIATDERGQVRFMNALAERLTGWNLAEALGKPLSEIFQIVHEKTRLPALNPALTALETGQSTELAPNTILVDRTGGERPIDDSAAPIRDLQDKITGAVLVFRDITERRRLEEHLRQSQKMEAIGRLAGGIAHDFNNIMTVITGFGELLLEGAHSGCEREDFLKSIVDAGNRAASLTRQIMAFSRKQLLVPCVLNLNTIVRDMGAMIKRLIGSNIEFVTETMADLAPVKVDPTQVGQVLLNLAANARDAMKMSGRLTIATANAELGLETTRQYPDVKPGRYVMLSVADTGCGMSEEILTRIFEPFFTTKGLGEGTGLGLATVYGITKQSEGHIEVSSAPGAGTTFRVYLPAVEEPLPTVTHSNAARAPRGNETILLVEDDDAVRMMTKIILDQNGYQVICAADGLAGVALAERHGTGLDLLITDLVMPSMLGGETAERVKALIPGIRVLYMSGYSEETIGDLGVETTANFLHKPFSLDALSNKVREILDQR